jgi:hypothetical protein
LSTGQARRAPSGRAGSDTIDARSRSRIFVPDGGIDRQLIPEAVAPSRVDYRDHSPVWRR